MLRVITEQKRIEKAEDQLRANLNKRCKPSKDGFWLEQDRISFRFVDPEVWGGNTRRFAHQIIISDGSANVSWTIEINVPVKGVNRNVAGVFLEGDDGTIYLGHRANKFNNLRLNRVTFWHHYQPGTFSRWVKVKETEDEKPIVVLAIHPINGENLVDALIAFAKEASRIRGLTQSGVSNSISRIDNWYNESEEPSKYGDSTAGHSSSHPSHKIHARVHNALGDQILEMLEDRNLQLPLQKDDFDMAIMDSSGEKCLALFEVKSGAEPGDVQKGIGQLFYYALDFKGEPKRILVLPNTVTPEIKRRIRRLQLQIITFEESTEGYTFNGLKALIKDLAANDAAIC